jgi:hypothetical protein
LFNGGVNYLIYAESNNQMIIFNEFNELGRKQPWNSLRYFPTALAMKVSRKPCKASVRMISALADIRYGCLQDTR